MREEAVYRLQRIPTIMKSNERTIEDAVDNLTMAKIVIHLNKILKKTPKRLQI